MKKNLLLFRAVSVLWAGFCPLVTRAQDPAGNQAPVTTDARQLLHQRADPHVFLHKDGYYYFTATAPEYDRIELRRVKSLADLPKAAAQVIWDRQSAPQTAGYIWAPEIHFMGGKWYVYFAAGPNKHLGSIRMHILENESSNPLEGEWKYKAKLNIGWESFALDASTFAHQGKRYMAWAQASPDYKGTGVYLAEMDTPWSIRQPIVLLTKPDYEWEKRGPHVNEAPAFLIRNGRVFMVFSASRTDENYCLGLLTASAGANLLDPASWKKTDKPVFASNPAASQWGPGHNSFTTSPDGKTDINIYHARSYQKIKGDSLFNPDRSVYAQPVRWNSDGTPDLGVPGDSNILPRNDF